MPAAPKQNTNMQETYSATHRQEEWSNQFLYMLKKYPGTYSGVAMELNNSHERTPNTGIHSLSIPKVLRLAGNATELDMNDTDNPVPLTGKTDSVTLDFKYYGAWMRFSDVFMRTYQFKDKVMDTYRMQIQEMAAVKRDDIAKEALWKGAGSRLMSVSGAADKDASGADGAPKAGLNVSEATGNISWDDLITENLAFDYVEDFLTDNTKGTFTMPGYNSLDDRTLLIIGKAGYKHLLMDDKYKSYITNGLTNDPYIANAITLEPWGFAIRQVKADAEAKVSTTNNGRKTTRSIAYLLKGTEALADIAIDNNSFQWIEADADVTGADMIDGLNRVKVKFGFKMYYGAKVLDSKCVRAIVYKSSMDK